MAARALLQRWIRLTVVLLLGAIGVGLAVRWALRRGPDLEGLYRQLPADTSNLVVLQHLDRLLPALTQLANAPGAPPELTGWVAALRRDSLAQAGFDATSPEAWRSAGFSPAGAFALASPVEADGLLFAYLPVRDGDAAATTLSTLLGHLGARVEKRPGESPRWLVGWDASGERLLPRAFALAHGNLVLALSPAPLGDLEARLQHQLQFGGLLHTAELQHVREALPEPWVVFGYVSPAQAQRALASQAQGTAGLSTYSSRGLGFSLRVSDERISGRIRILGDAAAPGFAHLPQVKPPADHLGGDPLAIARVSFDLQGWIAALEQTPEGKARLDQLQRALAPRGVDVRAELQNTFDGQLAAAVLPPSPGSAFPDGALLVGLKDPARGRALLPKLLEGFPVQPDVAGWYRMPQVAAGVSGDALVALWGGERSDAEGQTVANQGPSLAAKLPDPIREAYTHGPLLFAWVDLERAAELLVHNPLPGIAGQARVLRGLQGASLGIDARAGVISVDADLWPPAGGFSHAIAGAHPDAGAPSPTP